MTSRKVLFGGSVIVVGIIFLLFSGIITVPRPAAPFSANVGGRGVVNMKVHEDGPLTTATKATQALAAKEELPKRDIVDNSGAMVFLKEYAKLFNRAQGLPVTVNPNIPSSIKTWWQAAAMIDWYINTPIRQPCTAKTAMGNWHVCQDQPFKVKPPCLVYSFGIAWDFSFDDAMGSLGCEVHSFDPSMKKGDHNRSKNVTFHNLGLSNVNMEAFDPRQDIYVHDNQTWKMRTLASVKEMLGHENRVIDVLKIDIEGHEWTVVDNLFETGMFPFVRQFLLEWHLFPTWPGREEYVHLYKVYTKLREMGFREFNKGPHAKTLNLEKFNNQGDNEFVNIFFNKKSG